MSAKKFVRTVSRSKSISTKLIRQIHVLQCIFMLYRVISRFDNIYFVNVVKLDNRGAWVEINENDKNIIPYSSNFQIKNMFAVTW